MKRVLIFSAAYYPFVGGAEVAIKEITDRIAPEDVEFCMVTPLLDGALPRQERVGNIAVYRIGVRSWGKTNQFLYQCAGALAGGRLHRRYHFDALWAVMAHSSGVPAALFTLLHPKVPYVLTLQEGDPPRQIERQMLPLWPLFKRAFTRADIVQPISTFLAQWARRMGCTGSVEIIPNGADIARFAGEPEAHQGVVLITTSRLVHKNAVDDIIRALPPLLPLVRLKILGTGPDEAALRALAHKESVANRVDFLGHVDHADMPAHLHGADIFVRPSRSEGQGASFIEAMAAGLPVIATQEGGIADFLFDAKRNPDKPTTGWAVDRDAPGQITEAIQEILANPAQVAQVVANAKAMVVQTYDWDLIAKAMRERVFGKVFKKPLQYRQ